MNLKASFENRFRSKLRGIKNAQYQGILYGAASYISGRLFLSVMFF
jgi:hypothetical protein